MKTVYHGTTLERANRIVECRILETTSVENQRYPDTESGYVYVTTILQNALDFSVRPCESEDTSWFVVFKFTIDESEMQIDEDEEKWGSYLFKDEEPCCFKIQRNIDLVSDDVNWFIYHNNERSIQGDFEDYLNYISKLAEEREWSK